ncbi:Protein LSM14 A [Geranomyces michiganensis]|nr:Protein LSM14 A [Geranomyces michiganensis]
MIPYLGSKISLISKSDIRYVGILIQIDQDESTVSLQNVQSWGTEGRRTNPAEELPPSEEIFPYVVFRGADVKDLHVMTAPEVPPAPRVPNDPAVIRSGGPHAGPGAAGGSEPGPHGGPPGFQGGHPNGPGPYHGMPAPNPYGMPPPQMGFGYPPPPPPPQDPQQYWGPTSGFPSQMESHGSQGPAGRPGPQRNENAPATTRRKPSGQSQPSSAVVDEAEVVQNFDTLNLNEVSEQPGVQTQNNTAGPPLPRKPRKGLAGVAGSSTVRPASPEKGASPTRQDASSTTVESKPQSSGSEPREAGSAEPTAADGTPQSDSSRLPGSGAHLLLHNGRQQRGRGARGRGGGGGGSAGGGAGRTTRITVPDSDFDFEIANSKFNKTELANEAPKVLHDAQHHAARRVDDNHDGDGNDANGHDEHEQEQVYQKSSFFDNISCESKDRAESGDGRGTRRVRQFEERRLNLETFGQMGVDNGRGGYRRGGYRRGGPSGGRGRGGGGGGYYHNNNTNGHYNNQGYNNNNHGGGGGGGGGGYPQRGGYHRGYGQQQNGHGGYQQQQQQQNHQQHHEQNLPNPTAL